LNPLKNAIEASVTNPEIEKEIFVDDKLLQVDYDENQMEIAFGNILQNAQQAMINRGHLKITINNVINNKESLGNQKIKTKLLKAEKYIRVIIEDNGIGIAREHLDKVFDVFFTTDIGIKKGLGLSIAKSIIEKHSGNIFIESEKSMGTKIYIYLPAIEEKIYSGGNEKLEITNRKPNAKKRILLMDDDENILELFQSIFERNDYDAEFAKNGFEALELYQKAVSTDKSFDLVILDIIIPGSMGGRETMQKLMIVDPAVKAIVASGYPNDPVMLQYEKYGFIAALSKPFEISSFITLVEGILK
jgi:two-component system, cell cycle sensor histidine kinase and response regulator CckA